MDQTQCDICKRTLPGSELISGHGIRHEIEDLIVKDHPEWNDNCHICHDDFNIYRVKYVSMLLEEEQGMVETLEKEVVESIRQSDLISANVNRTYQDKLTLGQRVADRVASFGGSWAFIGSFFLVLMAWIAINSVALLTQPFDPYPFILLNLILSCLAAIQAPVIMMSQNRQESKDRVRAENDYKVNLKSEIEIKTLHEKVDHLLLDQWSKMMKIQEMQLEVLEEIRKKVDGK
jgi:uncharacterized membrane protein